MLPPFALIRSAPLSPSHLCYCSGNKARLVLSITFQMELKTDDQQVPVQTPTTEKKPRGRPRKINKIVSIKSNAL